MEQSQRLAHVLLQCCRQIAEAMPRLRGFKDISHYTVEINRLENDGDRDHAARRWRRCSTTASTRWS